MKYKICILFFYVSFTLFSQVVKTGIDVLQQRNFDVLSGKRVGLITNPTGVNKNLKSTVDILQVS